MRTTLEKLTRVYDKLQDEESRLLFHARLAYALNGNTADFFSAVGEMYDDWHSPQLEKKLSALSTRDIVVVGSGYNANITKRLLAYWGYDIRCFCETNPELLEAAGAIDGIETLLLDNAVKRYPSALFIVGSWSYRKEMVEAMRSQRLPDSQILLPTYKYLLAFRGDQYFDVFEPEADEIYVDAGAFNGNSVVAFHQWAKENIRKIYAFEALRKMYKVTQENIRRNGIKHAEVLNYAAWDRKETLYFKAAGAESCISDSGTIEIRAIDIDSVVGGEKVTLIKMDIEGSELKALHGAKNTIIKNRPRLAICVYHKPDDIPEIGDYILDLVPEYKLYIRHYNSNKWETVLYAVL